MTDNSSYELIFNLKNEIEKIALTKDDVINTITDSDLPVQSRVIQTKINQITTDLTNVINGLNDLSTNLSNQYYSKTDLPTYYYTKENINQNFYTKENIDNDFYTKQECDNKYSAESIYNMYGHPKQTNILVDELIEPGYYQYVGDEYSIPHIVCAPDNNIPYKNGFIHVERQGDYIVQHLYATSLNTDAQFHIDGRIFIRAGDISELNSIEWKVQHLPYRERSDLLSGDNGIQDNNVDNFTIYESTAGYTFHWKQNGSQEKYLLSTTSNVFKTIVKFQTLPIESPFIFGNLIGHIDVKIEDDNCQVRSVNNNGDYIIGVNNNFFVPRTN